MSKIKVKMSMPVYQDLSILDISKIATYGKWYNYLKTNCSNIMKLCDIDKDICMVHMKTKDVYADLAKHAEKRLGTSNYEFGRP